VSQEFTKEHLERSDPMHHESRIAGFHKLSLSERRRTLTDRIGLGDGEIDRSLHAGGLDAPTADKMVENALGCYSLPFGVGLNVRVNGVDRLAPMVVEEPSVIAAASNAARMVRAEGGFYAEHLGTLMTAQVQLHEVLDPVRGAERICAQEKALLAACSASVPNLVARGGGPRSLEVRDLGEGYMVVHIYVDCLDAMGANLVNGVAEAVGARIAALAEGTLGLRILTNLCDGRRVRVRCRARAEDLATRRSGSADGYTGDQVIERIERASTFAERDPYRAATHNKGVMNGIDSVVLATGNDFRAVEAGAHAYASRSGAYRPLSIWRRDGDCLVGEIELPLALGIVGGTLRLQPAARLALRLARITSSADLAALAASVGLASNLAALRALATEGIQRGHMSLHARSVATAAGARGDEVELIAKRLSIGPAINLEAAASILGELRLAELPTGAAP
jgi:hydroxymethylglutaryl-CoA reductase